MLKKDIALGISDFKELREQNIYFVDKTPLIKDFMSDKSKIVVLPRPRRFGKTLNMSMLKYFLDNKESSKKLFEGLEIEKEREFLDKNLNKHPLIYLSLKEAKKDTWLESLNVIKNLIVEEYKRHRNVVDYLDQDEQEYFNRVIEEGEKGDLESSLLNLTKFLEKQYGKKAIVLIDEYDATIHKAYIKEYYEEAISFFQTFYGSVFKDNIHLNKGLMTGILRISKESIFSGLNNAAVFTILSLPYSKFFGFTEEEAFKLLEEYNLSSKGIKEWYNGYKFGKYRMYNPWSVINYVRNKGELKEYWVNTSSNDLIREITKTIGKDLEKDILSLLSNYSINREVNENINFKNLELDSFYSLLLFTGYLTWEGDPVSKYKKLILPNMEVKVFFSDLLIEIGKRKRSAGEIFESIEEKNWDKFAEMLENYLKNSFSYYDLSKKSSEKDYHLIIMGMLIGLSADHIVTSNRESGNGRYDILLKNKNSGEGIIFEVKKSDKEDNLKKMSESAIKQIEEKEYGEQISKLTKVGIAFCGKKMKISWKTNF